MGWIKNAAETIREALAGGRQDLAREEKTPRADPEPDAETVGPAWHPAYYDARDAGHSPDAAEAIADQADRARKQDRHEGVTHEDSGTVNISGQAIGRQDPGPEEPGPAAPQRQAEAGSGAEPGSPYVHNSGQRGQINMGRTAVGPNAQVNIRGSEVEFGSFTQPPSRQPRHDLGPQAEPEAGG